jgi:hypothetical protein
LSPRFLVVVPAYNEAASIAEVAGRASRHADVCVVDDASTDATAAACARGRRPPREEHAHRGRDPDGFRTPARRARPPSMDAGPTIWTRSRSWRADADLVGYARGAGAGAASRSRAATG